MAFLTETRVNTYTADDQDQPSVAALTGGGYVVTWTSYRQDGSGYGVYAQRYDGGGNALGAESRVNTTTASDQHEPSVAALSDGGYVVTWTSYVQDGSGNGVYAQRYDGGGNALGAESRVNTTTADHQFAPSVAALSGGGYVVTWQSFDQDGSGWGVYAQRYDSAGNALGAEARANTTTASDQHRASVAALSDGGYVVAWTSFNQDGSADGIYAQRYDNAGNALGAETRVNTTTESYQYAPSMAALSDGGYVVIWQSYNQDGSGWGVYAQRYDSAGNALGSETRVNTTTEDHQVDPSVAGLSDGGYLVSWTSVNQDGSYHGVYAQRYDGAGNAVGAETLVNTTTADIQNQPETAGLSDGGYVVTWLSVGQDGSGGGVYQKLFPAPSSDDSLPGTSGDDELSGLAGNDTLAGLAGGDRLDGGTGNDLLDGGDGFDIAIFAGATSAIQVNLGAAGPQTIGGGLGVDTLISIEMAIGSAYSDTLVGSADNNNLQGGKGDDRIDGAGGGDGAVYDTAEGGVNVSLAISGPQSVGGGEGVDTLISIEGLIGSSHADTLTGDSAANFLEGYAGDDRLDGGGGFDLVRYLFTASGVTVDLNQTGAQNVGGGQGLDTILNVEGVTGSAFGDTLTGDAAGNVLDGRGGDDLLSGLGGVDTLQGGDGRDTLQGGAGNDLLTGGAHNDSLAGGNDQDFLEGDEGDDTLDGGAGFDHATYVNAAGSVTVNLAVAGPQAVGADQGVDNLISIEGVVGSAFDDNLTGDAAQNVLTGASGDDTLNGAGGNDFLSGLVGDDRMDGGDGFDRATYQNSTGVRVDLAITGPQNVGGGHGTDILIGIEGVNGWTGNDTLLGDAGVNELFGNPGSDSLAGRAGNDSLGGDLGDDTLAGGAGNDMLFGGDGVDLAQLSGLRSQYVIDVVGDGFLVVTDLRAGSPDGTDTLSGVEGFQFSDGTFAVAQLDDPISNPGGSGSGAITGGLGDDNLGGGSGSDTVAAGAGDDAVTGGSGADVALGGSGNDTLDGGSGDDSLSGDAGNDSLIGGAGGDSLSGGVGADSLSGGSGGDYFVFAPASASGARDVVLDFGNGDRIQVLGGLTVASATAANLAGGAAADTLLTFSDGSSAILADFALAKWNGGSGWIVN